MIPTKGSFNPAKRNRKVNGYQAEQGDQSNIQLHLWHSV
jgi:hypothetical protein